MAAALVDSVEAAGIDPSVVLDGSPFTREQLREWSRRIPWDDYVDMWDRLEAKVGRQFILDEVADRYDDQFPEVRALAGSIVSPMAFARFYLSLASGAVPHLRVETRFLNEREFTLRIEIPEPYRDSPVYLQTSAVAMRAISRYLGLPPSEVRATFAPRVVDMHITMPASRTIPARIEGASTAFASKALSLMAALQLDLHLTPGNPAPPASPSAVDACERLAREWKLTRRESQVLAAIADGKANKEIADALSCSVRTAEVHVLHLLRKAGVRTRAELAAVVRGRSERR